jgi:hypothetical protein
MWQDRSKVRANGNRAAPPYDGWRRSGRDVDGQSDPNLRRGRRLVARSAPCRAAERGGGEQTGSPGYHGPPDSFHCCENPLRGGLALWNRRIPAQLPSTLRSSILRAPDPPERGLTGNGEASNERDNTYHKQSAGTGRGTRNLHFSAEERCNSRCSCPNYPPAFVRRSWARIYGRMWTTESKLRLGGKRIPVDVQAPARASYSLNCSKLTVTSRTDRSSQFSRPH